MKPFVTCVYDYHQFRIVLRALDHAGLYWKYEEIDCGHSVLTNGGAQYHAIFYPVEYDVEPVEKNEKLKEIQNMMAEWKEKIWQ